MVQSIPTPLSFFRTTNSLDVSVFEKLPVISIEVKCGPGAKVARFFRHFIADNIVIAILRNISENQAKHFPLRPLRWREEDLRGERTWREDENCSPSCEPIGEVLRWRLDQKEAGSGMPGDLL